MQVNNDIFMYVVVKTKAHKNEVVCFKDDRLHVTLRAVPEKGKANEALIDLLHEHFGIAKSRIEILHGTTTKYKKIVLRNCTLEDISKKLPLS